MSRMQIKSYSKTESRFKRSQLKLEHIYPYLNFNIKLIQYECKIIIHKYKNIYGFALKLSF